MRTVLFAGETRLSGAVLEAIAARPGGLAALVLAPYASGLGGPDLRGAAEQVGARVIGTGPDLRAPALRDALVDLAPDVIVVGSFDRKIPRELRRLARRAALNGHRSLLPAYRGACPEFWAIANGEAETGVTVHVLSSRFDEGPIVVQERVPIAARETFGTLRRKLGPAAARVLGEALDRLERGRLGARRQSRDGGVPT